MAESERKDSLKYVVHRNTWIWGRTWEIITEDGVGIIKVSEDEDSIALSGLSVLPDHRRKGIGTLLIREAERIVKEEIGDADICLSVETENEELIDWYRRLGYHILGRDQEYTDMMKFCAS